MLWLFPALPAGVPDGDAAAPPASSSDLGVNVGIAIGIAALGVILAAGPELMGHNLETVPRLYQKARAGADYQRSLGLLAVSKRMAPDIPTKSGLMLGMGETIAEILAAMKDLHQAGCTMLTLGQYLQPTRDHLPIIRYIDPDEFNELRLAGLEMGFAHVEAGPLVRSSYHAAEQFKGDHDDQS